MYGLVQFSLYGRFPFSQTLEYSLWVSRFGAHNPVLDSVTSVFCFSPNVTRHWPVPWESCLAFWTAPFNRSSVPSSLPLCEVCRAGVFRYKYHGKWRPVASRDREQRTSSPATQLLTVSTEHSLENGPIHKIRFFLNTNFMNEGVHLLSALLVFSISFVM